MPRNKTAIAALSAALIAVLALGLTAAPDEAPAGDAAAMQARLNTIINSTLADNDAYEKLQELCDDIGARLSGSKGLEKAIAWARAELEADGQENVRLEEVQVPKWVRGQESLVMLEPRPFPMAMLGLGGSIATPKEGITAEVLVVKDKAELDAAGEAARGKIVLFNYPMPKYDPVKGAGYGDTVRYRSSGALWAAEKGALAALVRSVTARSLRSPHTGGMRYGDATKKIPTCAVSVEDAELMARLAARGKTIKVRLTMEARDEGLAPSHNVIGELRGREKPDEYVIIGGHIDSWDVGQGAHDDGAGVVIAMEALSRLRKLGLRPRRSIRVVLWTNEENGLAGARAYFKAHQKEMPRVFAAIESDSGGFEPQGFNIDLADEDKRSRAVAQVARLLEGFGPLTRQLGAAKGYAGADVNPMKFSGVPLLGLKVDGSKYFDTHHTHADTIDKVDRGELTRCTATMAAMAYALAEMDGKLGE